MSSLTGINLCWLLLDDGQRSNRIRRFFLKENNKCISDIYMNVHKSKRKKKTFSSSFSLDMETSVLVTHYTWRGSMGEVCGLSDQTGRTDAKTTALENSHWGAKFRQLEKDHDLGRSGERDCGQAYTGWQGSSRGWGWGGVFVGVSPLTTSIIWLDSAFRRFAPASGEKNSSITYQLEGTGRDPWEC